LMSMMPIVERELLKKTQWKTASAIWKSSV
jgi:hypothetical protein